MAQWNAPAAPKPPRWLDLAPGEKMIARTRTHPKTLIFPAILAAILVIAGIIAGQYASENVTYNLDGRDAGQLLAWLMPAVLSVVAAAIVLRNLTGWIAHTYTITTDRIVERYGILSTGRRSVPATRITETATSRSITDRIVAAGTLRINVAGGPGLLLRSIPDATQIQAQLNELGQPRYVY